MRLIGRQEAAFQKTGELVVEAYLLVGDWPVACERKRATQQGCRQSPPGRGQLVGPVRQVSAEQFVGAFAAEGNCSLGFREPGKKPDRQGAGIGVGLVGVVGELADGALQVGFGFKSNSTCSVPYLAATWRMKVVSSKLRP